MLLETKPNRRLIKLDSRSPSIAPIPTSTPTPAGTIRHNATSSVIKGASTTPRQVFESPKQR